ncbi:MULTISPECIES: type II secretion system inner membrane protein GspF [unclassified Moraxella]|uniref:type II secretion system inner membrane protein GspF n=1 Tax=unclassified Moraxella TaxID=2685852 RepID=UPI003AF9655E
MPAYQYKALDSMGKSQQGILEGDSARQIRQQLRDKSLLPIEVNPVQKQATGQKRFWQKGMGAYDLALMTRQLSVLLASAIPIEQALHAIAKQSEKHHVKALTHAVRAKVLEGYSLANALQEAGNFPPIYIATISAGERSGHLDLILNQLADYTENRFAMQKKIQGALVYPVILLIMAVAVVVGLMTFVVPKIVKVFEQSEQALPWITQVVLGASNLLTHWWWLLLIGLALAVIVLVKFINTQAGRASFDALVLRLPIFGKLSRSLNASRFASTLAILVRSGVPLVEALAIGGAVTSNVHIKHTIEHATEKVTEGASLSNQLERSNYFPPMMVQMIKSGENSGELDNMLTRASDMQQNQATNMISTLLSLLEPLMLVLMGVIVMTIVMAVMLPIINMNDLAG